MKLHVRTEREGVAELVVGDLDILRQHGSNGPVLAPGDQALVDLLQDDAGGIVRAHARENIADVVVEHDVELVPWAAAGAAAPSHIAAAAATICT